VYVAYATMAFCIDKDAKVVKVMSSIFFPFCIYPLESFNLPCQQQSYIKLDLFFNLAILVSGLGHAEDENSSHDVFFLGGGGVQFPPSNFSCTKLSN
jgi:hypothetical protein